MTTMMNNLSNPHILEGSSCYLSGGMQFAIDGGIGWRKDFINQTSGLDIRLSISDPTNRTINRNHWFPFLKEAEEEQSYARKLRAENKWDELTAYVHAFRRMDLRAVDQCDFVVVTIDTTIHQAGTWDEVFVAEKQKKPILVILPHKKEKAPDWLFGVVDWRTEMFDSVHACVNYIDNINKGLITLDDRWVLVSRKTFFGDNNASNS